MSVLTLALSQDDVQALTNLLHQHHQARLDQLAALSLSRPHVRRAGLAARAAVDEISDAFGRLADGSYGWCTGCLAAMPRELLYAAPAARHCPDCSC